MKTCSSVLEVLSLSDNIVSRRFWLMSTLTQEKKKSPVVLFIWTHHQTSSIYRSFPQRRVNNYLCVIL